MGYAKLSQKGKGIHLRQFARAFILDDGEERFAFISVDCAMIGNGLRREVSTLGREECRTNAAIRVDSVNTRDYLGDLNMEGRITFKGHHCIRRL